METNMTTAKCRICCSCDVAQGGEFFELREVCAFVRGQVSRITAEVLGAPLVNIVTPSDGSVCGACALERARRVVAYAAKPAKPARRRRSAEERARIAAGGHPWVHDEE